MKRCGDVRSGHRRTRAMTGFSTDARPAPHAWYALAVLGVATIFGFVDRQILVLLAEPLKHDLSLRDVQFGAIQSSGPALFAVLAAVPLGWLADRTNPASVLLVCVLVWSAFTAACGLAGSFQQLFLCTIGIAIGEAALGPIVYSLIPSLFPGSSRLTANFVYFGIATLGAGVGLMAGGAIIAALPAVRPLLPAVLGGLDSWRLVFFAVALPGPLIAVAVAFIATVRPSRALQVASAPFRVGEYFRCHGRTVASLYTAGGLYSFAVAAGSAWLPVALARAFKVGPESVGVGLGLSFAAGSVAGLATAMLTAPVWRRLWGVIAVPRAMAVTLAASVLPTLGLAWVASPWQAYVLCGVQTATVVAGAALSPAMLQEIAPAPLRARLLAFNSVVYVSIGAMSPLLVGIASDRAPAVPRALLDAVITVTAVGFTLAAVMYRVTERPFARTAMTLSASRGVASADPSTMSRSEAGPRL